MDISRILTLLADSEDSGIVITEGGFLTKHMTVFGIVLAVVGLLIIYVGVKVMKGFRFMPEMNETQLVEDELPSTNADIIERRSTEIPDYSPHGTGKTVFKEMLIRYEVDGQSFEEWLADTGEYGDTLPIKYNPTNPQDFHVYQGDDDFMGIPDENGDLSGNEDDNAEGEEIPENKSTTGVMMIIVGVLVAVVGVIITAEGAMK